MIILIKILNYHSMEFSVKICFVFSDYAVQIFHDALNSGVHNCYLRPDCTLPMMCIDDCLRYFILHMNTVSPQIVCIFVQKIHRTIWNPAIWICTRIWFKIRAIVRNRAILLVTSNTSGVNRAIVKSHYLNPLYLRTHCN